MCPRESPTRVARIQPARCQDGERRIGGSMTDPARKRDRKSIPERYLPFLYTSSAACSSFLLYSATSSLMTFSAACLA